MTEPTPPGKWPTPAIVVTCVIGLVVVLCGGLAAFASLLPPSTADTTTRAADQSKTVTAPTTTPAPPASSATTVSAPPTAVTTTTPPPSPTPAMTVYTGAVGNIPAVPDAATIGLYIGTLDGINPEILEGGSTEALVARGRDQCRDFKERPKSSWVFQAQQRFNSPDHPDGFDVSTTNRIIAAVRKYICPGY